MINSSGDNITLNETGIANHFEKNTFYKRYQNYTTTQWLDVTDGMIIILFLRTFYRLDGNGNL